MNPSTRRLSEVARHVIIPSGIVSTGWPAVEAKCAEFGDTFDEWQRGAGRLILAKREDGSYAATIGGITLSIPRQVAKTFLVGRIVFALCALFPGLKVLWTAHRTRTATNTFKSLQGYAKRPAVAPYIEDIRRTNGEQEILFTNGSVIMFGARETGFGRGFDEVDIEVFDEAQILTEKALEDMVAATNQSRHPAGALLFFMGTPPRPVDPGEAFTLRRAEALAHKQQGAAFGEPVIGDEAVYIECSADRGADPDDRKQWTIANPSFPHRTPLRSMLRLRKNLPQVGSWRREALGIWDADGSHRVISESGWIDSLEVGYQRGDHLRYAVDIDEDDDGVEWCSLGVSDGALAELVKTAPDFDWLLAGLVEHGISEVGLLQASPAGKLITPLEAAGISVVLVKPAEFNQACQQFADGVNHRRIKRRVEQGALSRAAAIVETREVDDGAYRFSRKASPGDISPLNACTIAVWMANSAKPVPTPGFMDLDELLEE